MKDFGNLFFGKLASLAAQIRATDASGQGLGFSDAIERAADVIEKTAADSGTVFFIGNGGSAAISSHMAIDFWKNGAIRAMAFNDASALTCLGNDCGYAHVFDKPIETFASSADTLVAISSSGRSDNILNGVKAAQAKGSNVLTLSGFDPDNPLSAIGEVNLFVPSHAYGPVEVLHQGLCHCILDLIMIRQGSLGKEHFL